MNEHTVATNDITLTKQPIPDKDLNLSGRLAGSKRGPTESRFDFMNFQQFMIWLPHVLVYQDLKLKNSHLTAKNG